MLLVRGALVLTMEPNQPVIQDGAVAVEGQKISAVGPFASLSARYPNAQVLGSKDHWVLPGMVNAHNHAGVVGDHFQRGLAEVPLERWLARLFNSRLLAGQITVSYPKTLLQAANLIRSGVTCTTDFYYGDGSEPYRGAEHALRAYEKTGMRAVFFLVAIDQPAVDNGDVRQFLHLMSPALVEKVESLGPKKHGSPATGYVEGWKRVYRDFDRGGEPIKIAIGPDGPTRCTRELLASLKELAREHGTVMQMHCLETKYQRLHWMKTKGETVVQTLKAWDFLCPELSLAHGIWFGEEDVPILADAGVSTVHCPSSNMRGGHGISPVRELLGRGVNVSLGTDAVGFSDDNDYIEELKLAALLQRTPGIEGRYLPGQQALEMATINGAKALGMEEQIGSLAPGKFADLITLSTKRMLSPYMCPEHTPQEILWRRARRDDVCDVVIQGQVVMRDRQLATIDVAPVMEELRHWYEKLWAERGAFEVQVAEVMREVDQVLIDYFGPLEDETGRPRNHYNLF